MGAGGSFALRCGGGALLAVLAAVAVAQQAPVPPVASRELAALSVHHVRASAPAEPVSVSARPPLEADGPPAAPAPAPRALDRRIYRVVFGDNWDNIAQRHGTTRSQLRRWNADVPRTFTAGTELVVWVAPDFQPAPPTTLGVDRDASGLPLVSVEAGAESVGQPTRGRLLDGTQVPHNPALYTVRRPDFAYGSSHAVANLQLAVAKFRAHSRYAGPLVISDMSRPRGRGFAHHNSHQSGRDVDVWLPLQSALWSGLGAPDPDDPIGFQRFSAERASDIDWDASLDLVLALIRTGEVQYVFLSRARQKHLYRTARARGMPVQQLGELIQYPRRAQTAIVRHAPSHDKHIHVRFRCAAHEARCY